MTEEPEILIVMGVCGVGKTSVAKLLADRLPAMYVEADDFHPERNVSMMRMGEPLTDEMRLPWLRGISEEIVALRRENQNKHIIVACSALKRSYRDLIRIYVPTAKTLFLNGSVDLIRQRLVARKDHFMPTTLLDSQLATLEPPQADENFLEISIERTRDQVVDDIISRLKMGRDPH